MTDRHQGFRTYCGERPPLGRTSATCLLSEGHEGQHRNMEGLRWDSPPGGGDDD